MSKLRNRAPVFLLFIFHCLNAPCQNLCPNPGFEQVSGCPAGPGELSLAIPWQDAGHPADLFNVCHSNMLPASCNDVSVPVNFAGVSTAHGGSSYAGIYTYTSTTDERTYLQATITPLVAGNLYRVSAFFRRSGFSKYATNRQAVVFATNPLVQPGTANIPVAPQMEISTVISDTSMWHAFAAYYIATGIESELVIGNFRDDANTQAFNFPVIAPPCSTMTGAAFYYVDDVSVTEVDEQLNVTGDTSLCTGESTTLQGTTNTTGWWSLLSLPNDTLTSVNGSLTVSPATTTTYLWHGIVESYVVTVSVLPPPVVQLRSDTVICEGQGVVLDAGNAGATYLWSNGATTQQITARDSGMYVVTVSNGACSVRDTFFLDIIPAPVPVLGGPYVLCPEMGETIDLDAGSGTSYLWFPGGDTTRIFSVNEPGHYSVMVGHPGGCSRSGSTDVTLWCPSTLFIPRAFTPNNDGKNDTFFAESTNLLSYEIVIFNRWGQVVFSSSLPGNAGAWNGSYNGTSCETGVFAYRIRYEALKESGSTKTEYVNGTFLLIK